MNKLPIDKRVQIINLLVEGNSLRATSHIADVSINTVTKLLSDIGKACEKFHQEKVTGINSKRIQADEIWSFCYANQKNVTKDKPEDAGDVWIWTALDEDSKLIVSWLVGDRSFNSARRFIQDVASRLSNRVQLTTEGHKRYLNAVDDAFDGEINYGQLIKIYGTPDKDIISASYVERQNLPMRMHMPRFTRLTNAYSKKIENHAYAIALHFVYYNFVKIHKAFLISPAMEAGLSKRLMTIEDIVRLTEK